MQKEYLDNWKNVFTTMQEPVQKMMDLNIRTLKKISYSHPEDFSKSQKLEEIMEKNANVFFDNAHKTLDYWQEAFRILEENMLHLSSQAKENTENFTRQSRAAMKEGFNSVEKGAKQAKSSTRESEKKQ